MSKIQDTTKSKPRNRLAHEWSDILKDIYLERRGEIKFGCHRTSVADTDTLFVDLELLPDGGSKEGKYFETYEDLFHVTDENRGQCLHILVRGHAGTGKSTMISRLAYKWATLGKDKGYQYLNMFDLVIVLDVRKFRAGMNLQEVIQNQLIPGVSVDRIGTELAAMGTECLFLVDGFDEMSQKAWQDESQILDSPLLSNSYFLLTTRPHMVDRFCERYAIKCAHVYLSGFSEWHVGEYVTKFFKLHGKTSLAVSLLAKIYSIPLLQSLSTFPILLLMLCHLWLDQERDHDLPLSLTEVYYEAIQYLNKHWEERYEKDREKIMLELGKAAIGSLFEGKLTFDSSKLSKECVKDACNIGLIYKEEMERHKTGITFIHKTFHEFCAAFYWSHLACNDTEKLKMSLEQHLISSTNVSDMEYLLRFCCGHDIKAASAVLNHVIKYFYNGKKSLNGTIPVILLNEATCRYQAKIGQQFYEEFTAFTANTSVTELSIGNPDLWIMLQCKLSSLLILLAYLPSVTNLQLMNINPSNDIMSWIANNKVPKAYEAIIGIEIENGYGRAIDITNGQTLVVLLHCMPSLQTLKLCGLHITGTLDSEMPVVWQSLTQFDMEGCVISANALLVMLSGMPSLPELILQDIKIEGNTDIEISGTCNALTNFEILNVDCVESITGDTLITLIRRMPSLQTLNLYNVEFRGELVSDIPAALKSLTHLDMKWCQINANILLLMLSGMPSLPELILNDVRIEGDADRKTRQPCNALTNFNIANQEGFGLGGEYYNPDITITGETWIAILCCMPSLQALELHDLNIGGKLDPEDIPVVWKLLTKLDMEWCIISANTLLVMLSGMPSLPELILKDIRIEGDADRGIRQPCYSLTNFEIVNQGSDQYNEDITITGRTLSSLLRCMPSLQTLKLCRINISGELVSDISVEWKSLTQFEIERCVISASTLLVMLSAMPSLPELILNDTELEGDAEIGISGTCKALTNFEIVNKAYIRKITRETLVTLLRYMPSLQVLKLLGLEISEELDLEISAVWQSLTQFDMEECVISANTLLEMMSGMPSLPKLILKNVEIEKEADREISEINNALTNFNVFGNFGVRDTTMITDETLIALLRCMPSLQVLKLHGLKVSDELDSDISVVWKSLTRLEIKVCHIYTNTLSALLSRMPSLLEINFEDIKYKDKEHTCHIKEEYNLTAEAVTEFKNCLIDVKRVSQYFDCDYESVTSESDSESESDETDSESESDETD